MYSTFLTPVKVHGAPRVVVVVVVLSLACCRALLPPPAVDVVHDADNHLGAARSLPF